jgi:hypothetical protein
MLDMNPASVGEVAPVVSGMDYTGDAVTIDAAEDGPTMVVLLAHWCPHCSTEISRLNEWRNAGQVPDDLNIVGIQLRGRLLPGQLPTRTVAGQRRLGVGRARVMGACCS